MGMWESCCLVVGTSDLYQVMSATSRLGSSPQRGCSCTSDICDMFRRLYRYSMPHNLFYPRVVLACTCIFYTQGWKGAYGTFRRTLKYVGLIIQGSFSPV